MRWILLFALCLPCWGEELLVEVEDSRLRAGDLAAALGPVAEPGLDIGPAPAPGVRRRVTRPQLERWAGRTGADTADLPDEIVVVRKMRPWPADEAVETLRGLLKAQTRADVSVEMTEFANREIPSGDLEWSLLGLPRFSERPVRMSLAWRDPGGRTGVEAVTALVRVRVTALVARRDLEAGAEIRPEDFELSRVDVTDLDKTYLIALQPDRTWTLKYQLKHGGALESSLLVERPEVERGAMVELLVSLGAVRLRAPARAEGAGSAGDLVPFRNLETNQRVLARVMDRKTAEVVTR